MKFFGVRCCCAGLFASPFRLKKENSGVPGSESLHMCRLDLETPVRQRVVLAFELTTTKRTPGRVL